jgi:hypothetical protein
MNGDDRVVDRRPGRVQVPNLQVCYDGVTYGIDLGEKNATAFE